MKIETSLDWKNISNKLHAQLNNLPYNSDLHKMLKNIDKMVDDLSKLEVIARRIRNTSYLTDKVSDINKSIDHLEKLILMASLMR
jgi:hypothetical protein